MAIVPVRVIGPGKQYGALRCRRTLVEFQPEDRRSDEQVVDYIRHDRLVESESLFGRVAVQLEFNSVFVERQVAYDQRLICGDLRVLAQVCLRIAPEQGEIQHGVYWSP